MRDIPAIKGDTLNRMESVKSQRKMSRKATASQMKLAKSQTATASTTEPAKTAQAPAAGDARYKLLLGDS